MFTLEVGIAVKKESTSEEGIAQKEEVIFQLFLFKEEIVVQQSKVVSSSSRASKGGQQSPAGWNLRARLRIGLAGVRSKIFQKDGA